MHDVIVQPVVDQNQVADVLRVGRNLQLQRVFHGANARHRVHRGAYAAETLGEKPGFARVAALEDALDAAPHGARRPGIRNRAVFNFHVDAEMSFDSSDWVNGDALRHCERSYERMFESLAA